MSALPGLEMTMATGFFPLFSGEGVPPEAQFLPAILLGFAFGFVLERSGFGNARVLASQFYLYNMRVFKVMFTAIVTAAVGVALATSFGQLSFADLYVPETFLWPHLVGGLLLGAGFIISGYCPGTSIVAAASGRVDGMLTVLGVVVGSVVYAELYPVIREFADSGAMGVFTFPAWLGIGLPILVLAVAVMAAVMFLGAEKVEGIFAPKAGKTKEPSLHKGTLGLLGGLAAAGAVAVAVFLALPRAPATAPAAEDVVPITAFDAARSLVENPRSLHVLDLRDRTACTEGKDRIPLAMCLSDVASDLAAMPAGRTLLVYGEGELAPDSLPAELVAFPGQVALLSGGLQAWKQLIVEAAPAADLLASLTAEQKALLPALHSYFTGTAVAVQPAAPRPTIKREIKKKGGGCS
ncbi:MAG: hypothetical protein FJ109_15380 [Deltaproteobacteria bacterium]|nr:hypothetical protein [Deltaproteobacteria bacterium]